VARRYHEHTKHTPESVRKRAGSVDWVTAGTHPFKYCRGVEPLALPSELPEYGAPALEALGGDQKSASRPLGVPELGRLLRWGAGVLRTRHLAPGDVYHFRTYRARVGSTRSRSTLPAPEVPGLAAGLYHFHPLELNLRRLRVDDVRALLAEAAGAPNWRKRVSCSS